MAASTHLVTPITPPTSSTATSSSAPVPTWTLSPLIMSSAVILACLFSAVVSTAAVEDIVLLSDSSISKDQGGKVVKMDATFASRANKTGSSIIQNIMTSVDVALHNDVKNSATSSRPELTSTHLRKSRRSQKATHLLATGDSALLHKKLPTHVGMETYLNMLDDKPLQQTFSTFVHFQSSAGSVDHHNNAGLNSTIKQQNRRFPTQGDLSQTVNEILNNREATRKLASNAMRWTKHGYLDMHREIEVDIQDDTAKLAGFKPLNLKSPTKSIMSTQPKRYPRSVDSSSEDEYRHSPRKEIMSRTLHYVDKLRSEPCPPGNNKIIILKPAKFPPELFFPEFAEEVNKTVQIANTISDLLLFTKSPPEDFIDVFYAMTQSLVETGPQVIGCAIAFSLLNSETISVSSTPAMSATPSPFLAPSETGNTQEKSLYEPQSLFPYSYRTKDGEVVVTDLSMLYKPQTTTWFTVHVNRSTEGLLKPKNRIYANRTDVGNITSYLAKWNKTVSVSPKDGYWATPYYDCLLRNWVAQYSVPFYQLERSTPEFKGVVLLEANFEAIQINQCAEDGSLFSDTHRCKRATTKCKNIPSSGLQVGSYECVCKDGYQFPVPNAANSVFEGRVVEYSYMDYINNISSNYTSDFDCLPMRVSTPSATPLSTEPLVTSDFLARGIPLGVQSFCMTVSMVIGIVIVCFRKTKVMRSSVWILLEMFLFGAILLYATVVIQYFEQTTTTCLLLPWFREVGFVIVYGSLVLKIYRILAEFQSRKAHRVHVRDKDLFKYLAVILIVVIAYMSAWTAVNIDHLHNNSTILEHLYTETDGLSYTLCRSMWWDYVIEIGEFIFLCFGTYMCYCVRSAPTEYSEGRFITCAICYEAVVSTIFYVLRHLWWYTLHPDHLFLMYFMRCQLTVTVVLFIILGPKLWFAHRPPDEDHARARAYSQSDVQDSSSPETMKLNVGISSNGDVEVGEISLTDMDPEDIRAELKRLYTQLQIYKTKTMRKDNPHISKRRGGRKQTHRRFSLQAFHHKHRHHHDHDHEHEMSKTPEESTVSAEAMTFTIEPSVKEDPNEGKALPTVSFKSGHK